MPIGVALTIRSASPVAPSRSRRSMTCPRRTGQPGRVAGTVGGAVEHADLAGTGLGQGQDHGTRRPAGADDQAAPPGGVEAGVLGQRAQEARAVGVLADQVVAVPADAVHGAEPARRPGDRRSTAAATSALWGMVTDNPPRPSVRMAPRARPRRCRRAPRRPGRPSPGRRRGEGGVVQDRRERVPDGVADHGRRPRSPTGDVHEIRPLRSAAATASSNSDWSSVKKW